MLGQNAAREAKTRGVLRPDWWWYDNGNPYVTQIPFTRNLSGGSVTIPPGTITSVGLVGTNEGGLVVSDPVSFPPPGGASGLSPNSIPLTPVCIDPWMINKGLLNYTPAQMTQLDLFAYGGGGNQTLRMPRVTLVQARTSDLNSGVLNPGKLRTSSPANDQSFMAQDDLAFALDQSNPDTPPAFGFNGNGLPTGLGLNVNGVAANGTKRNYNGQFTWLATVVPLYGDGVQVVNRNLVQLSVVVFNQRVALPTAPPGGVTERAASRCSSH